MTVEMVLLLFFVSALMTFLMHASESSQSSLVQTEHDELEEAWHVQEITDTARQAMYREVRHSVSGESE